MRGRVPGTECLIPPIRLVERLDVGDLRAMTAIVKHKLVKGAGSPGQQVERRLDLGPRRFRTLEHHDIAARKPRLAHEEFSQRGCVVLGPLQRARTRAVGEAKFGALIRAGDQRQPIGTSTPCCQDRKCQTPSWFFGAGGFLSVYDSRYRSPHHLPETGFPMNATTEALPPDPFDEPKLPEGLLQTALAGPGDPRKNAALLELIRRMLP
jgi:hypothetical protein